MASAPHAQCCQGKVASGDPVGSVTQIAGLNTYVSGQKTHSAVLIVTDIFGIELPNVLLLADFIARVPSLTAVAKELKEKHGVTKLASFGLCWGGWAALQLSRDKLVDGVIVAHPSLLNFPADIENIASPSLFLCAATDQQFPKDTRIKSEEILEKKLSFPSKFVYYPGTEHGFAVRGDAKDAHVRAAAEDAASQVVLFAHRFLK